MASYSTSEFKSGLKVMLDGDPCAIIENEFVKPGKGQAFNRVKLRNLKTGKVWERTFKSGDSLEGADVLDVQMQYIFSDGEFWHFMDTDTFEQKQADEAAVGDAKQWLKEEDMCEVTLYNGEPLNVKGDTAGTGGKPATLSTGAVIRVPLFVQEGEIAKVDTRTGEYAGRIKN